LKPKRSDFDAVLGGGGLCDRTNHPLVKVVVEVKERLLKRAEFARLTTEVPVDDHERRMR
jgi:hypothetical protein